MLTNRFRIALGVALILTTVLSEQPAARAADDATRSLPEGALIVVRLNAPRRTLAKWRRFAAKLDPSYSLMMTPWEGMLGGLIANPDMIGVDMDRDWWMAVYPGPDDSPEVVYAIPAKDVGFMQSALGESIHSAKIGRWGVYSASEAAGKRISQLSTGDVKSISATLDKQSKELLLRGDVTAYVNLAAIKSKYRSELDLVRDELNKALVEVARNLPGKQGGDTKILVETYSKVAHAVLQGVDDSRAFTFSALVGLQGLQFEEYLAVTPDSPTAKFLQSQSTSEFKLLEKLPAGQHVYFGLHGDTSSLMKWSMEMSALLVQGDPASRKSMQELAAQYATLKFGDHLWSIGPDESGESLFQMTTVTEVTPVRRMKELARKTPDVMSKVKTPGVKQTMSLKVDAEKYGTLSGDILTLKQELDAEADPFGIVSKISETIYGPEGMVTRTVYTASKVVQTIGGGRAAMEGILKRVGFGDGSVVSNKLVRNVRTALDKEANLVVLVDIPSFVIDTLLLLSIDESIPIPFDTDAIAGLDVKKSYLGFSLAAESEGVRAQTHIPTAQLLNLIKLGEFAMESLGPLMMGPSIQPGDPPDSDKSGDDGDGF